jgi:aminopeptidase N
MMKLIAITILAIAASTLTAAAQTRQYAPDRKVDILHVRIDVTPDFEKKTISGEVRIRFKPIAKPLTDIQLDAVDLTVHKVVSDAKLAGHTVTDEKIEVVFDPPVAPDREVYLDITYEAEPKMGLYFRTPDMGYKPEDVHLWTQGESHEARYWFPNYDYPNERFTSEVICHVPAAMTVLSNGRLISEEKDPRTGLKSVRWLQDKPHANYLIALAAGMFKKVESKYRDIPIAFYTPTSYIDQAANSFEGTDDMLAFFEQEIGVPYPWAKYDQVVVDDFAAGGMENTSLTILNTRTLFTKETENIESSRSLVSHEMVHQWFGDYVTCKDWTNVWLNEGFATYYENLYDGHHNGHDSFLYQMYSDARGILASEGRDANIRPIYERTYEDSGEQFDYRAYSKGGWVLHMLRCQLGESLFRKCIKTYLERHALDIVVTADLQAVVEELSGRSFDQFFDQWVFHAGHPRLDVSYKWSARDRLAQITVKQTPPKDDKTLLFQLPTKVRFYVAGKPIDHDIVIAKEREDFYVPLPAEPNIVRFDPEYTLLADVTFDTSTSMLYQQLRNKEDVIGQILAIKVLAKKDDKKTISELKTALNEAPFYGVRVEAAQALADIHTDDAFAALDASRTQSDARVRRSVVQDLGRFYRPETLPILLSVLETEKNPAIRAAAIDDLGCFQDEKVGALLRDYLKSDSYRNRLADAAVQAIRQLRDPAFIEPLQQTIREREDRFTARGMASALETLATVAQDQDDKTGVYRFISGYVNHKRQAIKVGAVSALGTLRDKRATAILETLVQDEAPSPLRGQAVGRAARRALDKLNGETKLVPQEVVELRKSVSDLKTENGKLRDRLDDVEGKLKALNKTNPGDAEAVSKTDMKPDQKLSDSNSPANKAKDDSPQR